MECFKPLIGFRAARVNAYGRREITFDRAQAFTDREVQVRCGRCIGCRLTQARDWAVRCTHEAQLHVENCVLTLTYSDENLPKDGSLVVRDLQLFWKRLRKALGKKKIKYLAVGEYGGVFGRPHYHALVFGHWFPDARPFKKGKGGSQQYRSPTLDKLWGLGIASIGELTPAAAGYVARYAVKKLGGVEHKRVNGEKVQEFIRVSIRPGIGRSWFERFANDVYPSNSTVLEGREGRVPAYYDKLFKRKEREAFEASKAQRASEGLKSVRPGERSKRRLAVKEEVARSRFNLYS